ncbi:DUF4062 domain-containing protein [Asticcacaulis sp.]|uniref:DUF4062 domain-containing protein n=1 Tax=Asticcacaulis sp. TaxID=1872648 RepID=UPI0031E1AE39
MAKPRIFLSSTCYDLGDARSELTTFLENLGFEVLNSQSGRFGVKPKVHSHEACLAMLENADYVILMIGGRRGGTYVHSEKSITNEEIRAAQKLNRPIFAFLDRKVDALRPVYRKNPTADFSPVVDDVRIFDFVDSLAAGHEDNWLHLFDTVVDIKTSLTAQFAYLLLLYSQSLRKKAPQAAQAVPMALPFPNLLDRAPGDSEPEQSTFRSGLRVVYDSLRKLLNADIKDGPKQEQLKSIWVIARHGEGEDCKIQVNEQRFKASAWGRSRGERVFAQMTDCGIEGFFDVDEDDMGRPIGVAGIVFSTDRGQSYPADALKVWVDALIARYGEDDALDRFKRLDMQIFASEDV